MALPVTVGGFPLMGVMLLAPNREKGGGRYGYMARTDSVRHFPYRTYRPGYPGK